MPDIYSKYDVVIGLEVHMQLQTKSKAFCGDSTEYGAEPNTLVSPISLAYPGTLPKLNKKSIEFAIKLGLATHCDINRENKFSRKNYFYPDLPKGYQITQFDTPICIDGHLDIKLESGVKRIGITRIHMEEDAGKSMHDIDPYNTLVDLNRAGMPLLEMVSEPDMNSSEDAYAYLTEVRKLIRYLDICDGNMEEGSMRCDANVSVMLKGAKSFGEKVEVKNMNSIRNVKAALEYEIKRQIDDIEAGEIILQETRNFNAETGKTTALRSKEAAHDYRYFTEPDLPPVYVTDADIEAVRADMPELPEALLQRFMKEFGLSEYDAQVLTDTREIALFFNEVTNQTKNYKAAANWVMGPLKSYLNENAMTLDDIAIKPKQIVELIALIDDGKVNFSSANMYIFPELIQDGNGSPLSIAEAKNIIQSSNQDEIGDKIQAILDKFPDKVSEYRGGKKGLIGLFMGELMRSSGGKVDPKTANKLLIEALEN